MTDGRSYRSPGAFRTALTDKLRDLATRSRWSLQQLQRQMAYDRLLQRLYLVDEGWIIKGATALLARDIGVRGTIDIDVYREVAREIAERDLRRAAALDIGDWFSFEIGAPRPVVNSGGVRLPVTALVGNTVWVQFHVDLVGTDLRMTGQPEDVPPLARVVMPDVEQHGYRAYPLVDHAADKVCAIIERHGPHGGAVDSIPGPRRPCCHRPCCVGGGGVPDGRAAIRGAAPRPAAAGAVRCPSPGPVGIRLRRRGRALPPADRSNAGRSPGHGHTVSRSTP